MDGWQALRGGCSVYCSAAEAYQLLVVKLVESFPRHHQQVLDSVVVE